MDDDFNTPMALSVLFDLAAEVNRSGSAQALVELRRLAALLGLLGRDPAEARRTGLHGTDAAAAGAPDDAAIEALIAARAEAKKAKNWAEADRLRDALVAEGIVLEDGPSGTTWRRA
jgi:cysteinyl-tRNA synthetase